MTTKQIELVQTSWKQVAQIDTQTVGSLFYNRLFEIAPEVKPMFSNITIEEQSRKLLTMLNYVIVKLDKLDDIIDEVKKLARSHVKYGVQDAHYPVVGSALLWTLEAGLGETWNDDLKNAWTDCYTTLSGAMVAAAQN